MKHLTLTASLAGIIATTAMGIFLSTVPASAQTTYMMTCKPGGSLYSTTRSKNDGTVSTIVFFKGGSQGAATRAPNSGECTWIDRGMRPGEPLKLLKSSETGRITSNCSASGCKTITTAPIGSKILKSIRDNRAFQVHVYNDGNGYMRITRFGP